MFVGHVDEDFSPPFFSRRSPLSAHNAEKVIVIRHYHDHNLLSPCSICFFISLFLIFSWHSPLSAHNAEKVGVTNVCYPWSIWFFIFVSLCLSIICSPWLICFLIFVSPRFSWTMRSCHWQDLWISVPRLWPYSPPSSPVYYLSIGWDQQVTAKRSPQSIMKKPWVLTLLHPSVPPNSLWPI